MSTNSPSSARQIWTQNVPEIRRSLLATRRLFGKPSSSENHSPVQSGRRKFTQLIKPRQPAASSSSDDLPHSWEIPGATEDELIFVFPDRPRPLESSSDEGDEELWPKWNPVTNNNGLQKKGGQDPRNERETNGKPSIDKDRWTRVDNRIPSPDRRKPVKDPITIEMRLMRCQNVWCIPSLSRLDTEQLLQHAEPGNFILRVSHNQHAMVLSRRVPLGRPSDGSPLTSVEHNVIEVFPRSGYCLTGDRQAQLIFGSLTQLLDFYIRVSRTRTNGDPFLRLPRAILDAQTLGDLDQINKQGVEFWKNLISSRQAATVEPSEPTKAARMVPERTRTDITVARSRPSSVDRWAGHLDDDDRVALADEDSGSAGRQLCARTRRGHQSRFVRGADGVAAAAQSIGHPPSRVRASSVHASRCVPERDNVAPSMYAPVHRTVQSIEPLNNNGISPRECIVSRAWGQLRPKPSPTARSTDMHAKPLINNRTHGTQTGIYEGSDSELWRTMTRCSLEKLSGRQQPTPAGVTRDYTVGSGLIPRPWLSSKVIDQSQSSSSSSQDRFNPGAASLQAAMAPLPSQPTSNGLLTRTLDQNLRSPGFVSSSRPEPPAPSACSTSPQISSLAFDSSWASNSPCHPDQTNSTDSYPMPSAAMNSTSRSSHSVDWMGEESSKRFCVNSMSTNNRPDTKASARQSPSGTNGSTKAAQLIELPAPKTVGRVFVMEAATYSSDDYELLSETGSAKPRMGRVLSTSANRPEGCQDWPPDSHSGCQTGSSVDENRGPRLRRAVTVRNPERVSTASSSQSAGVRAMDDIEPRRRHGIFLEDLVSWRTNNQRDVRNAIYQKENDVDVRNGTTVEVSKLLACSPPNQSNGMQITRNEMSNAITTTAEPIQCSTTSAPASNKFVANSTQARSISDADDKTKAKSAVPVIEQKANNTRTPVLTLLAAPKNSIGTTAEDHRSPLIDWDPPPPPPGPPPPATPVFTPRTQADTDPGSVDKPQADSTNLSPSQSSRASTVFCPPWDTAPLGLYLSDLINMTKPLVGSVSGPGANSRPPRDTALRRRTLSAFEHRLWSERLSALSDSSPVTNNRTEVQKLLNWWLHSNGVPPTEERRSDKETSRHGTDTKETNGSDDAPPPPVPQRRRRTRGPKMSLTTSGLSDDLGNRIIVSDIAPYAVVTCAPNIQRTVGIPEHEQPRGQEQQQQIDRLDTTEPFAVYDEAFMDCEVGSANLCSANCCTAVVRTEPLLSAAKPVSSQIGPGVTDSHPPSSYVYAQVVPHHLRRRPEASSAEEQQQQNQDSAEEELGSVSDRIARFQGKPIMTVRSTGTGDRADSIRQSAVTTAERVSPGPSTMSSSSSSSSSFSSNESDCRAGADLIGIHENPCRHHQHASTRPPSDNPSRPRASPGRHIRHFVHRLLKDKNGKVAEQVNLFLECTRDGSDRGPYEIMQSIRQFISGMTNYLLRNPELGLPAAVELEKQELSDFGFLNVGAMLESSLQKHVLRPLYRHVIKLLKQEQIKHNELDPMRTYVQWVWSTPAAYVVSNELGHQNRLGPAHEAVVEHVTQLFHRMERTYSVGCKMHYLMEIFHTIRASNPTDTEQPTAINHNMTASPTAFEPLCAWVFARAGLLLAPLVVDPVDQQKQQKPQQQQYKQPQHHQTAWNNQQMTVFCPAALQADYLEGLLHKSSLRNQAHSQACLNDLFGMLYWVWSSRSPADTSAGPNFMTLPYRTSAGSQAELEFSDTLHSELFRGLDQGHGTLPISIQPSPSRKGSIGRISDRDDPDTSDTGPAGSVPVDGHFGSTKRRIIPPRRRKTITGLHGTKLSGSGANGESRSGSPVAQSKFHGSFKSNTLNRYSDSKPQSEMTSQDGLGPITPGHSLCPRWRPWAPQTSALSASSTDALVQHHTQNHVQLLGLQPQPQQHLRVLVMDESSNQLQSQSYPLRPTLTVSELSNLIAFKMKIFDPKEFSLFAYVDGREIALDDSFSLSEFVDTTTDFHGSQMTLQGRSTTGTLNSKLDLSNQLMPSLNKSNNVHSVSSRSDSPTGSSTESQKRFQRRGSRPQPPTIQQQQQQQQHSNVPWWVLCKKLSNTNASRFGSGTELVGPAPSAIDVAGAAGLGSWTRPLLIFRRANGYFAISDRLLRSLDDPPSSF